MHLKNRNDVPVIHVATYMQEEATASSCFEWPTTSILPLHVNVAMELPPLEIGLATLLVPVRSGTF